MTCLVKNCRYPNTHVTTGHMCGTCHKYGHGMMEHHNPIYQKELEEKFKMIDNSLPVAKHCTIEGCYYCAHHTTEGHYCRVCKNFGHSINFHDCKFCGSCQHKSNDCPHKAAFEESELIPYPRKEALEILGTIEGKIYTQLYAGMGCLWYARRLGINKEIDFCFLHTDCCGQYGLDDQIAVRHFIKNCQPIKNPLIS